MRDLFVGWRAPGWSAVDGEPGYGIVEVVVGGQGVDQPSACRAGAGGVDLTPQRVDGAPLTPPLIDTTTRVVSVSSPTQSA